MDVLFHILISDTGVFQFLHILAQLDMVCPFDDSHVSGHEMVSQGGFNLFLE